MARMRSEDLEDITRDKTLLDVYNNVVRRIHGRRLYKVIPILVFALVLVSGLMADSSAKLGDRARDWGLIVFQYAYSVLGILLAGFTIFSTISMSDLVRHLVGLKEPTTGLSYLKYITGHFIGVFISYMVYLAVYGLVFLFGWPGGPAYEITAWLATLTGWPTIWKLGPSIVMATVGAFLVHLILMLQSFVFNVYNAFMFMVRAKLETDPETAPTSPETQNTQRVEHDQQNQGGRSRVPADAAVSESKDAAEAEALAEEEAASLEARRRH